MNLRATSGIAIDLGTPALGVADLGYVPVKQEQDEWCWAACIEMVLHKSGDTSKQQGDLADAAFGETGCLLAPKSSFCDRPIQIDHFGTEYNRYGFNCVGPSGALSFAQIQAEIAAGRPVQVGVLWTLGGGHAVLVTGWDQQGTDQFVRVDDPDHGSTGMKHYSELLTAFGEGTWSYSWTMIAKSS